MITASDVFSDIRHALDDDSSGRYDIANDLVPAVNSAIDFWTNVLSSGFESKRIVHESLADLVKVKHFTAVVSDNTAAVNLPDADKVWTVFGVDLDPIQVTGVWVGRGKKATRRTLAEWGFESGNPFAEGTDEAVISGLERAIYVGIGSYKGTADKGILIRPTSLLNTAKDVLVWYLKTPDRVVDGTSNIEFPQSMRSLITQKAVNHISFQHGGNAPYYQITDKEVNQLATLLVS